MDREYQSINEDAKKALRQCLAILCESMLTTELVVRMRSKNALSGVEVQAIEAQPIQFQKNYEIVKLLETKNQKAFGTFIECLWKTGQQHLAKEVLNSLDGKEYAAELLTACQLQRQDAGTPQERDIKKIQTALKEMYLQRFKKVSPFSLPFTFDIENTWVSLAMREDAKDLHTTAETISVSRKLQDEQMSALAERLQEDFENSRTTEDHAGLLKSAFEKAKMLIIEGRPATGKTSLMRRLAYEWAKGEQKLSLYDLVLYAEFREVREKEFETIAELVLKYNETFMESEEFEHLTSCLLDRKHCEQQRILLLLDGYDESSLDNQCKELCAYLTSTTIRKKIVFKIVITTRPGYLGQHRGKEGRYIFADVLGFTTKEQKDKYISNHFFSQPENKKQEKIAAICHLLETNESVNTLAETPLFLTFICLVYERLESGTVLELYCNVIWWMINRHQTDNPDRDVPSLFEFSEGSSDKFRTIQNNYLRFPQLLNVGKMAFHNKYNDIFNESDCVQYNLKEIIQQVGLLRKDEFYDRSFHLITTFSFPHRTIQEFLAAFYCFSSHELFDLGFKSDLNTDTPQEYDMFLLRIALSDKIPINEETRTHYFDVIENFLLDKNCDALHTSSGVEIKLLNKFLSQCNKIRFLKMFTCIFEANSQLSFQNNALLKKLELKYCTIHRGTAFNIAQLKAINSLKFDECEFDTEAWQSITEDIRQSSVKCLDLSFKWKYFNKEYVNQLQNCNNIIIKMTIENYTFMSNDLLLFSEINLHSLTFYKCSFKANPQLILRDSALLKKPELENCTIHRGTAVGIAQPKAIDTLKFNECKIDMEAWQSITEDMRKTSVKCLVLSFKRNDFNKEYINYLQKCNNTIVKMTIEECKIRSNDLLLFNEINLHSLTFFRCTLEANSQLSFSNSASLEKLRWGLCTIHRGTALGIAQLKAIDILQFDNCEIDMDAWQSITEDMRKTSVKCLVLSFKRNDFNKEYINYLQKCNNTIVKMTIEECKIRSNDLLLFNEINLHSLQLWNCSFEANSQLSFRNSASFEKLELSSCTIHRGTILGIAQLKAIDSLEFYDCNIDMEVWQSITEEIRSSSVKCLKFTPDMSKYLEFLQECNKTEQIYMVNSLYYTPEGTDKNFEDYKYDIVEQLLKLAQNMQRLKRIVFDFAEWEGELKESNKGLIEKAGQERDPTFTVSIIPFEPSGEF